MVVAVALAAGLLGGCGKGSPPVATPLPAAPEPAVSPPVTGSVPGTVLPMAGAPEGVVVDRSGAVAVNVRQPDGLVLFDLTDPDHRQTVPLPGSARHLALASPDGPVLVPSETDDRLAEVALPSGEVVRSVPVGRQPHDAAAAGADTVFVGDEFGNTVHVVRGSVTARVVPAPLQPGGLAASADGSVVVAVGVRGRRMTAYRGDGSTIGTANCGAGPTHVVAGDGGLFWVADTDGGALLGFRVDSRGPHQVVRIPVGPKPYGEAYDARRGTLWVTLTATNQLVGLHLAGTEVRSRTTLATVQQPNTVAVDIATGELVVTGSTPNGSLQIIGVNSGAPA